MSTTDDEIEVRFGSCVLFDGVKLSSLWGYLIWQVRLCDQQNINEFGRLNNKLLELQADINQYTMDVEKLEDGASELMMVTDDKVMLFIGETFFECSEEYATEYCENKAEVSLPVIQYFPSHCRTIALLCCWALLTMWWRFSGNEAANSRHEGRGWGHPGPADSAQEGSVRPLWRHHQFGELASWLELTWLDLWYERFRALLLFDGALAGA